MLGFWNKVQFVVLVYAVYNEIHWKILILMVNCLANVVLICANFEFHFHFGE